MKKRLFSTLLIFTMALSLLPTTALASDPIADQYTIDGVTYFSVNSDHFDESSKLFIQDMLNAHEQDLLGIQSTATSWQWLAACIQSCHGAGTSEGKFKTQLDNAIIAGVSDQRGNTNAYSQNNFSSGDNTYNIHISTLTYANSMSAAASAMEEQMFQWYRGAGGGRNDKYGNADSAAIAKNDTLWNDTDSDDVFWILTGAYKTSGTNKQGHY